MYDTLLELRGRGHRILIATPGMDVDAVARVVAEADGLVEQIVILAYPPVARDILDRPELMAGRDFKLILGGEPMSEIVRQRNHVLLGDPEGDRIRVVYGATDVGFVGYETTATVAIRRAAAADPALNARVFALEDPQEGELVQQPAFVQYRPDATYVERDQDGYLLFTVDGVLPLVRYRVNDRGDVLRGSEIYERLVAAGRPDLAVMVDQTGMYLLVHGRTDIAAIISGANIYPDYVRPAVEHISLATRLTGDFYFRPAADEGEHADVDLVAELRAGVDADDETAEHLKQLVIASLRQLSAEYRIVHDTRVAVAEPRVVLLHFGAGGFGTAGKARTVRP
jgi:phenylacetate-CoA ligase